MESKNETKKHSSYGIKNNNIKKKKKKKVQKIIKINDKLNNGITSLIFFDLEMNCSFHKEENHGVGETISIGAVKYNINTEEIQDFYSVIRPTFNNIMSAKILELTKLLQDEVNGAKSFKEVFLDVDRWVNEEKCIFISWGSDDIRVLLGDNDRNGYNLDIINTIKINFIDFQSEYGYRRKSSQAISLKNALAQYNIEFEGCQHNALDDAYNLFRVYKQYEKEICYNDSLEINEEKQLGS